MRCRHCKAPFVLRPSVGRWRERVYCSHNCERRSNRERERLARQATATPRPCCSGCGRQLGRSTAVSCSDCRRRRTYDTCLLPGCCNFLGRCQKKYCCAEHRSHHARQLAQVVPPTCERCGAPTRRDVDGSRFCSRRQHGCAWTSTPTRRAA